MTPIEHLTWEKVLGPLGKRIGEEADKLPKGDARQEFQAYWLHLLMITNGFKDAHRNHVSHSRVSYDATQALGVLGPVKAFMIELAKHVSE